MKLYIKHRNTEVKYHIIKSKLIKGQTRIVSNQPTAASMFGGAAE